MLAMAKNNLGRMDLVALTYPVKGWPKPHRNVIVRVCPGSGMSW
jgi:hypothetical protein